MNKEIIKRAKQTYTELMNTKTELIEIKEKLSENRQDPQIEKCIKVITREEKKIPSEEEILKYSFYEAEQEQSECDFYVFIGGYKNIKNGNSVRVNNYKQADYFVYQNLEKMFSGVVIYPSEYYQFEKENTIFKFDDQDNIREKFLKLQLIYFREYLNNEDISQDELYFRLVKSIGGIK